ncbi:TonB-dependent receptor [Sphingobacterium bambusae]|uniref:TonB-dependent receptor domain-containing protein n=1 Tax=Sphingobacterium bambusae TaxID=662858 RepID=A0ABW6BK79_9SPHI|nr:TonB-dependent receptor [Sphingobacterium bambusae]WPL50096.1 TonB-dependent receptor [Sphingobacterium bambusae]
MNKFSYYVALIISLLTIQHSVVKAQQFGVKGKVLDLETYQPIPGVSIKIANTNLATSTNESGEFSITLPTKGSEYILVSTFVGYDADSTKFTLQTNSWEFVPVSLINSSSTLDEVVVTRRRERVSEIALLDERRLSNLMVEKVGSQELSRKGVGDAASAMAKMSGVSKVDGSNQVYVRGLGDRYNSTSYNGLPIPSNNPERKNINLDIFSTDIVDYIAIDKVYNSYMSGDFAGGNVDIAAKSYSGTGLLEVSLGSSINTNVVDKWGNFSLQQGPSRSGFVNYGVPNDPLGGYNFSNTLNPVNVNPIPANVGVLGGKSFEFKNGQRLNLFAIANYTSDYNYREGVNRSVAAGGEQLKDFHQTRFGFSTNSTAMLNANYVFNPNHKIAYNFLFINSSDQFRDTYSGFIRDLAENGTGIIQRGTFVQNKLFVEQLLGNHQFTDRIGVDWGASYNNIISSIPDRTQNITRQDDNLNFRTIAQNQPTDNHRYYQDLTENELAFNLVGNYKLGDPDNSRGKLSIGYNGKIKRREFEDIQFNLRVSATGLEQEVDPNNLDAFFNKGNYEDGYFGIEGFVRDFPQVYSGRQNIHAGFANVDYKLTDKLTGILGFRYENIMQSIFYRTNLDRSGTTNTFNRNGFLPNLMLKYEVSDKQNLRLGASKTYTLPQFKERAYFIYEDVTEIKVGNPDLYPSEDYNLDLKWEMFPKSGELLSFTAFGKYIKDPINEVTLASSTNDISFLNTGDYGTVYGAEIEVKKDLVTFDNGDKLTFGANAAYMKTNQDLSAEKVRNETNFNLNLTYDKASFTGASDFLANADLSYVKKWNAESDLMATVVYNHFSDRLYALGTEGKGNQVDKAVGTLDFIMKYKLNRRFGIDLTARNLLDPSYERVQENQNAPVTILSYKKGVRFSLGLKYNLF